MSTSIPPPEKAESIKTRSWIIYSFWAVIVLLGVPTWWQTTSIPRAALPLEDMLTWPESTASRSQYTIPIRVATRELPCDTAVKIAAETEHLLNEKNTFKEFGFSVQLVRFPVTEVGGQRAGKPSCPFDLVHPNIHTATLDIELVAGSDFNLDVSSTASPAVATYAAQDISTLAPNLAEALRRVLADEQAAVAYQYYNEGRSDPALQTYMESLPGEVKGVVRENAARAFKASPDYHLTFSLFTPGSNPSGWDIGSAVSQYIHPLLYALSGSTNFTVTTQIQLYSSFSPSIQPYQEDNSSGWFLRKSDLTAFINTAEWPLSPSIGSGPTINFVLYIPSKQQTPLRVEGNENDGALGGSWLVPQWGGIAILNAPIVRNDPNVNREDAVAHLGANLLEPAFEVFRYQLLALLGVPSSPTISLPLRLKAFQRLSALSLHLRTISTLGSLARLAQHLGSIPIPRHVSELVKSAMASLRVYEQGLDEKSRIAAASGGYKASEKAFFDKSMIGQVYFPDEHKVAVYLPLLGPIGVPLVVGILREVKALAVRLKR